MRKEDIDDLRRKIYFRFAECFKEPSREFGEDVRTGILQDFFTLSFKVLGLSSVMKEVDLKIQTLWTLRSEYNSLFVGPMPPYVVPVESVYKRWTQDPDCKLLIAHKKGFLMGDPAIDMIRRYQAAGITIPAKFKSMPDHIALLLEYIGLLCEQGCWKVQKGFIENHFDWLGFLCKDISNNTSNTFYRALTNDLLIFVQKDKEYLDSKSLFEN